MEDMIKSNPQLTLSGLVPGILTNRLALRTRPPRCEKGEEVGDDAVEISSSDFFDPIERPYYFPAEFMHHTTAQQREMTFMTRHHNRSCSAIIQHDRVIVPCGLGSRASGHPRFATASSASIRRRTSPVPPRPRRD